MVPFMWHLEKPELSERKADSWLPEVNSWGQVFYKGAVSRRIWGHD